MRKHGKIKAAVAIIAVCSALTITVLADYDSSEDPIVSLSYLREIFRPELISEIDNKIDEKLSGISAQAPETNPGTAPATPETAVPETPASTAYEVIEMKQGDALYAASSCEIILRSGSVICLAPDNKQGIADMTSGAEIYKDQALTKNHYCLIPRADGRGVLATTGTVFIMIRGDYTIVQNAN